MEITLQGSLKFFKLPEILTFLHLSEKSGTLNLVSGSKELYIYFRSGSVVFATSNQEQFRLAAVLLRKKKIDYAQWRKIEEPMLRLGEKFGRIAVEQNILTDEELQDYLKIQVSEIIYDCFVWSDGKFSYLDVMQLPEYAVTISIDLTNLIMEGARRIDEMGYFTQHLPKKTAVLRVIGNPASQEKINLSLDEWNILFLINGKRSLEEVCTESKGDLLDVYRVIYGLYANKLIEIVSEEEAMVASIRERKEEKALILLEPPTHKLTKPDTGLLISPQAVLTFKDLLKVTLAQLTLKKRQAEQKIFPLIEQEYLIGRQMGNDIHIADPSISNVHAKIFKGPEGYVLEDLNSRNGTFLNGVRIDRRLLHDHDTISIGNSSLVYNIVFEVKRAPDSSVRSPAS